MVALPTAAALPVVTPLPPPQLIGTAHGQLLENLIKNPTLSDLVGGICSVTLGEGGQPRVGTGQAQLMAGGLHGRCSVDDH